MGIWKGRDMKRAIDKEAFFKGRMDSRKRCRVGECDKIIISRTVVVRIRGDTGIRESRVNKDNWLSGGIRRGIGSTWSKSIRLKRIIKRGRRSLGRRISIRRGRRNY